MKKIGIKQLKIILAVCFAASIIISFAFNSDGDDDLKNIGAIGCLVLAAACVMSYTRIVIEENRNNK
jgi:hypothetical protein